MDDKPHEPIKIEDDLLFELLDVLRLAHVYVLKDTHPEELGPDFKPWKWMDSREYAEHTVSVHKRLLQVACGQRGIPYGGTDPAPRNGST